MAKKCFKYIKGTKLCVSLAKKKAFLSVEKGKKAYKMPVISTAGTQSMKGLSIWAMGIAEAGESALKDGGYACNFIKASLKKL